MATPPVLILRAPGTNCDQETAYAFHRAGGRPEVVHVNRLLEKPDLLVPFQILCIPGGFSYGDDVAAGRIFGIQLQHHLADWIHEFKAAKKLILGICNGFQVLIKSGALLADDAHGTPATLTWNDSGVYGDRWVRLSVCGTRCVFLAGIHQMYLPVAHAEGKFVARDGEMLQRLAAHEQLVLRYQPQQPGTAKPAWLNGAAGDQTFPFPDNPNGSQANTAGVCDPTGRVLGLMPHPERHIDPTHHPRWTRGEGNGVGDGLQVFVNAIEYFG